MAATKRNAAVDRRRRLAAKKRAYRPYDPNRKPPSGSYDPAIDAESRSADRGFGYLEDDFERGGGRAGEDFAVGIEDLGRTRSRSLADLMRDRTRAGEDYGQRIGSLNRDYERLGSQQMQSARSKGVAGGALVQSMQKRQANKAFDQAPIDQGFQRFTQDSGEAESRMQQDFGTPGVEGSFGSLGERMKLDFDRGTQDRSTNFERGGTEHRAFGQDAQAARLHQAFQSTGWTPPKKPKGEKTVNGQTYRLIRGRSGQLLKLLPSGRIVKRTNTASIR